VIDLEWIASSCRLATQPADLLLGQNPLGELPVLMAETTCRG
jgi:hypothetical protein